MCPDCSYSLLGLEPVEGTIRCPECGKHFFLADHHLTPEDLLAKPAISASANHQEDPT
jgi:DNA-directed RNA polymerase subunit RPC12/RpoP